jgi:nitroimidazol reductase NimA-like FMN-containing flavoprotein (pyridoxamine 5'-phosphate oxidase superfamily)
MGESDVKDMLKTTKVGLLCLEDGDKPYAVPLEHYFDGKNLYLATALGEGLGKTNCIKNNSNACYSVYDSRRQNPELVSQDIRCRSLLVEGKISIAGIKELTDKEFGKVQLQMLKLEVKEIGNWQCPRETCHWHEQWFIRHPELVEGL